MPIFKGAAVAIVTPFTKDNQVNYKELGKIIDYQIAHHTDAIVICGTTGEASTLTRPEHLSCIRFAVEYTHGRVPVIAGSGSNCTETAVTLSKSAEQLGADGLLVVTPYYNKATQTGLMEHYTAIAKKVSIPIIMYNVPGRTGCNLLPETAAKLGKTVDNIVAIKEASGNISQVAKLAALSEGALDIYSGNDDQIVPILSLGGIGVISVLSNVAPELTHDMVVEYLRGNVEKSAKLQGSCIDLVEALFSEVNPIPVKAAMNIQGFQVGNPRKPLTPMEPKNIERLRKSMEEAGIYRVAS